MITVQGWIPSCQQHCPPQACQPCTPHQCSCRGTGFHTSVPSGAQAGWVRHLSHGKWNVLAPQPRQEISDKPRGVAHTCFGWTFHHITWKSKMAKVTPVIQVTDPAQTWLFSGVSLGAWNDMEFMSPCCPTGHTPVSQQDVPNRGSTRRVRDRHCCEWTDLGEELNLIPLQNGPAVPMAGTTFFSRFGWFFLL